VANGSPWWFIGGEVYFRFLIPTRPQYNQKKKKFLTQKKTFQTVVLSQGQTFGGSYAPTITVVLILALPSGDRTTLRYSSNAKRYRKKHGGKNTNLCVFRNAPLFTLPRGHTLVSTSFLLSRDTFFVCFFAYFQPCVSP
jgi:hypothetical protein